MDLLEHLILDYLAPDTLDLVTPIRTYSPDFEKFSTRQQTKHVFLHQADRDTFYANSTGHHD